jgi:translation elongation factor EF-1beta
MLTEEDNQFAHLTEEKLTDWESSTEHLVSTHSLTQFEPTNAHLLTFAEKRELDNEERIRELDLLEIMYEDRVLMIKFNTMLGIKKIANHPYKGIWKGFNAYISWFESQMVKQITALGMESNKLNTKSDTPVEETEMKRKKLLERLKKILEQDLEAFKSDEYNYDFGLETFKVIIAEAEKQDIEQRKDED